MLVSGLSGTSSKGNFNSEDMLELLSQVTRLYMALLQLENFAVMNYCGLGKILKVMIFVVELVVLLYTDR